MLDAPPGEDDEPLVRAGGATALDPPVAEMADGARVPREDLADGGGGARLAAAPPEADPRGGLPAAAPVEGESRRADGLADGEAADDVLEDLRREGVQARLRLLRRRPPETAAAASGVGATPPCFFFFYRTREAAETARRRADKAADGDVNLGFWIWERVFVV